MNTKKTIAASVTGLSLALSGNGCAEVDYHDYMLKKSSRVRENIEWTINYSFNDPDKKSPRVLLIGDSICNAYKDDVRNMLKDKVNVTFWASSRCVTDPSYARELDFILDGGPYSIIMFNNGLHSLLTDQTEWREAYRNMVRFIMAKCPNTKLTLVYSTPLKLEEKTVISRQLNAIVKEVAEEFSLPVADLFTPFDPLDRETYWGDTYHFKKEAILMQAEILSNHILNRLDLSGKQGELIQKSSETGPSGALK